MNELVAAGYEVHVNFSPVIVSDEWESDWRQLFEQMDSRLTAATKQQLKAEVIFLTHNAQLHEVNLSWHPRAEDILWRPDLQAEVVAKRAAEPEVSVRKQADLPG